MCALPLETHHSYAAGLGIALETDASAFSPFLSSILLSVVASESNFVQPLGGLCTQKAIRQRLCLEFPSGNNRSANPLLSDPFLSVIIFHEYLNQLMTCIGEVASVRQVCLDSFAVDFGVDLQSIRSAAIRVCECLACIPETLLLPSTGVCPRILQLVQSVKRCLPVLINAANGVSLAPFASSQELKSEVQPILEAIALLGHEDRQDVLRLIHLKSRFPHLLRINITPGEIPQDGFLKVYH
jgi:hypothetical protein